MRPKPVTWCNLLNGVGCLAMFQDNFFRYIISRKKKRYLDAAFFQRKLDYGQKERKISSSRSLMFLCKVVSQLRIYTMCYCLACEDHLISCEPNAKINKPSP